LVRGESLPSKISIRGAPGGDPQGDALGSIYRLLRSDIFAPVTKRLIEIDDAKLAAAQKELGAPTIKMTVDKALDEVLALVARRRALMAEQSVDISELADEQKRRSAWG